MKNIEMIIFQISILQELKFKFPVSTGIKFLLNFAQLSIHSEV